MPGISDNEYTCIFPQPGCEIDALTRVPGAPPEWVGRAREIVAQTRFAQRAAEGLRYQGCCCDYGLHLLLADETVEMLRAAGFVVENDCEPADTEQA